MAVSTWQTPLFKLFALLILLPWTATYLHLYYYTFWQYEYCLVGPPTSIFSTMRLNEYNLAVAEGTNGNPKIRAINNEFDVSNLYGIYAPQSQKKKKGENELDRRTFRQKYSTGYSSKNYPSFAWMHSSGWPSLTQAAMMIAAPSSTLSKYSYIYDEQDAAHNNQHEILFVEKDNTKMWCLQSTATGDKWCSSPLNSYPEGTIHQYPPGGAWYHSSSSDSKPPISISCPSPSTTFPSATQTKRHQQQNAKQNQNVKFLLQHPTTALFLLLNTFLAYQYWNHRISPSSVCKSYNKICTQHEWWRSFTGATAHFEPLHIGFNMISLHTLGKELEGGFGSVIFLVYNIALVVMCTMTMMGMVYGRLVWARYRPNGEGEGALQEKEKGLKETSTVGYSGVLFAWMVM
jgi:membrane associated rhomboid family serine protease